MKSDDRKWWQGWRVTWDPKPFYWALIGGALLLAKALAESGPGLFRH